MGRDVKVFDSGFRVYKCILYYKESLGLIGKKISSNLV